MAEEYVAPVTGVFAGGPNSYFGADRPTVTKVRSHGKLTIVRNVGRLHAGDDWAVPPGTPVHAVVGGKVVSVSQTGRGNYGLVMNVLGDDGNIQRYAMHNLGASIKVKVGERVEKGAIIGSAGPLTKGGYSHLHMEFIPPTSRVFAATKAGQFTSTSWHPGTKPSNLDQAKLFGLKPYAQVTGGKVITGSEPIGKPPVEKDPLGVTDFQANRANALTIKSSKNDPAAVKALQGQLAAEGLYAGKIDGDFGRGTEKAVNKLKADLGLPQDGKADAPVMTALNSRATMQGVAQSGDFGRGDLGQLAVGASDFGFMPALSRNALFQEPGAPSPPGNVGGPQVAASGDASAAGSPGVSAAMTGQVNRLASSQDASGAVPAYARGATAATIENASRNAYNPGAAAMGLGGVAPGEANQLDGVNTSGNGPGRSPSGPALVSAATDSVAPELNRLKAGDPFATPAMKTVPQQPAPVLTADQTDAAKAALTPALAARKEAMDGTVASGVPLPRQRPDTVAEGIPLPKERPDHEPDTVLRKGMKGYAEIGDYQKQLADAGLYPANMIDNWYGPKTEKAVKTLQSAFDMPATGKIDNATRSVLNHVAVMSAVEQQPGPSGYMASAATQAAVAQPDATATPVAAVQQNVTGGHSADTLSGEATGNRLMSGGGYVVGSGGGGGGDSARSNALAANYTKSADTSSDQWGYTPPSKATTTTRSGGIGHA